MAFPVVSTKTLSSGTEDGVSTASLPATINAGDLLIAFLVVDTNNTITTTPSDSTSDTWTSLVSSTSASGQTLGAAYKIADGDEDGGTLTWSHTGGVENWQSMVYRVTSWHGTTPPEATSLTTGTGTSSNPPLLNPGGWGTEDTLWISWLGTVEDMTGVTAPSGYTFNTTQGTDWDQDGTGAANAKIAVAYLESAAASEDPGSWTGFASGGHASGTVGVRPGGGAPFAPKIFEFAVG